MKKTEERAEQKTYQQSKQVVMLTPRYWPHLGGVETHLHQVLPFLQKAGYQVTIITEQYDSQLPLHEVHQQVKVWRVPTSTLPIHKQAIWSWLWSHRQLLQQADLIHVHDVFVWLLPLRFLWPTKKIYITFHGYEAPGPLTPIQVAWHQLGELCTEGNIVVGGFHHKWYGIEPNYITYGGISSELAHTPVGTASSSSSAHKALSTHQASHTKKLIFIGRLASDTGVLAYLQALKIASLTGNLLTLDVYGDGPLRSECESFVKEHHLPVSFHGFVQRPEQYLAQYDCALVSQYLSILNALAAQVHVIAFADTPIKKDYLSLTPFRDWITVAHSMEEIVEAVEAGESESDVSQKAQAQAWVQQQTWKKLSELYLQLWQS